MRKTTDEILKHIEARKKTINDSIVSEQIAGNEHKELCEKTALCELEQLELFITLR